ncbi:MAG: MFS transporter [Sphingomonadaceae bacterium]|nr:MFS transporter [Sphingomonadaceae bacterium]
MSGRYRTYVMSLLLGIYILNFVDRQVVNILAEPIKHDLGLADWQLGLMGGLAFAVLYTVMGVPIALIAERRSRPTIIAIAIATWSACTAVCGLAQNFVQLVLARIGVGIGEAGCTPPAHSLILDYSPREKRGSALAFYGMGAPIGGLLGMAFGGLVADAYGWRMAFLIAGAPGVFFAILTYFTLKEPRKMLAAGQQKSAKSGVTIREALRVLGSKPSFYWAVGGISIKAFISIGYTLFMASFFLRNHGAAVAEYAQALGGLQSMGFLGLTIGLVSGTFGALGMWTGGQLADRVASKDIRWHMWGCAIAAVLFIPPFVLAMTTDSFLLALACMAVSSVIGTLHYGPGISATLSVAPSHMRAPASAIHLFIANLVGLGLGPLAVGALSDYLAVSLGTGEGLRWAMVIASFGGIPAAFMFWMAAGTLRENMES